ncbi:hypothetical protein [Nocardioides pocheonensis]|uniref:hypothetical protein n=1 Tax=Nocardioides pocheonensis TaxID=661485 RepID=UPI001621802C|nr:hypothetical protein [Nocardioides pocheonensis]
MSSKGAERRLGRIGLVAVVLALSMSMFGLVANTASATHVNAHKLHDSAPNVTVLSYVYGHTASGKKVRGVFVPRSFQTSGNTLYAKGKIVGKIVRPGKDLHFTKRHVLIPVYSINNISASGATRALPVAGTCDILHLVLGPLDLNILGLKVHLDRVVLDITAQPGSGQLLGNLLCAVAGLLDPGGTLSGLLGQLNTLLNQILGALGRLTV